MCASRPANRTITRDANTTREPQATYDKIKDQLIGHIVLHVGQRLSLYLRLTYINSRWDWQTVSNDSSTIP